MSLSKSHATLDYFDTSMSVSWRGGYIPSPKKKKIKTNQNEEKKTPRATKISKQKRISVWRDGLKLIIK